MEPSTSNHNMEEAPAKRAKMNTLNIKIRQEPEDNNRSYINKSKQQEIIEYFHNPDQDADRRRLKNKEIKITIHTEDLRPSEVVQIARQMNATRIEKQSNNKRFTHAYIQLKETTLTHKLDVPATHRLNQEPQNLMRNSDIQTTAEQSTQVNPTDFNEETTAQLTENEEELRDIIHPELEPLPIIGQLEHNPQMTNPTIDFPNNTHFNLKTFINYTDTNTPTNVAYILGMGPKFAAPLNAENDRKLYEKIETITMDLYKKHTEPNDHTNIVQHIKTCIDAHQKHGQRFQTEIRQFYDQSMTDTVEFFKHNKDLIATQTDKSKAAVLMYKQDYIDRMYVHLSDTNTYSKLKYSSLEGYKIVNERFLTILTNMKYITPYQKETAVRDEVEISNMYGLIKDHKPDKKIRPICNTRNTPGYLLAKTISQILTNALKPNIYDIKNSVELKQRLADGEYTPTMILASLDVVSMFTNITFERVARAIQKRYAKKTIKTNLSIKHMLDMLQFICCYNTEIQFNSTKYKQIKGLRMGSPVSPILAQIVMDDILDEAFSQIKRPQIFVKYVDDILTIARPEELDQITQTLNRIDPNIQFELEIENPQTQSINFLELSIINKHDTTIGIKWYQKEVSSKRILNYHSQHAPFQIEATARNYAINMLQLSDTEYIDEITNKAEHILKINNFPHRFIRDTITEAKKKTHPTLTSTQNDRNTQAAETATQTQDERPDTQPIMFMAAKAMPYVKNLSQQLTKGIKQQNPGIMIPSSTINTVQQKVYNRHKNLNKRKRGDDTAEEIETTSNYTQQSNQSIE